MFLSAPVGVDDQADNWDSRPSNPISYWSPADQARQPWQIAQSFLWISSSVGTEFPRLVKTHMQTLTHGLFCVYLESMNLHVGKVTDWIVM